MRHNLQGFSAYPPVCPKFCVFPIANVTCQFISKTKLNRIYPIALPQNLPTSFHF